MPILRISIFFMLCFVILLATGANAMSQKQPLATLTLPNYAITETPNEDSMEKYEAVIKDYVIKTRNWTNDEYFIKIRPFSAQLMLNKKDCISFSVIDRPHQEQQAANKELSTDGGRSFGVILDINQMQVIQEIRYM